MPQRFAFVRFARKLKNHVIAVQFWTELSFERDEIFILELVDLEENVAVLVAN